MRLTRYLQLTHISRAAFGKSVGLHASTISRLCRGETSPDWNTVNTIAAATGFQVTANDWLEHWREVNIPPLADVARAA